MSGHWPPDWDDSEDEFPGEAEQTGAAVLPDDGEARLSEVAAFLASVPVPALPDAVGARITAALAAEAATRSHPVGPAPARARVRRGRPDGQRRPANRGQRARDFMRHPLVATGTMFVCLALVITGIALAGGGTPSSSSGPVAGAAAPAASSSSAPGSSDASAASSALSPAESAPRPSPTGPEYAAGSAAFSVTASGTRYERATLAEQVRARSARTSASVGAAPSAALRGCVTHLTGGPPPRLVDRATYQGQPAYVIASSTRAWVVGLGCTAAKTELIVSVALAGLPGNLRALISVEQ